MSAASLRRRIAKAGESRRLTDGEAQALLAAPKFVRDEVAWTTQDIRFVRMEVPVGNAMGESLKLTGSINRELRGRSSWTLTWGAKSAGDLPEAIRRLDLRGKHRNPDGQLWVNETHKHKWTEVSGNDWAYTPDDIPHESPGEIVGADDYREVFEAFAAECGVELGSGYRWVDPQLDRAPGDIGLWEVR